MMDEGVRTGAEPACEIWVHQATSHSTSSYMAAFTTDFPPPASFVPKKHMWPWHQHLLLQRQKVMCVALTSLNNNLGQVAIPLFFPEASLHSESQNIDTYFELIRVNA